MSYGGYTFPAESYGTAGSSGSQIVTVTTDFSSEHGGIWHINYAAWPASGAGLLDQANVFIRVRWTDPTGTLNDLNPTILSLFNGATSVQDSIPIMYQANGTLELEFDYQNILGNPPYGYAFMLMHPFGSY